MAGLEPRGFKWVIAGRLAVSERIGGYGFQHRRVRREEEIIWLSEQGINAVLSFLPGSQNQAAYAGASFEFYNYAIEDDRKKEEELYDLESDLGEQTNLAAKFPEKVTELRTLMQSIEGTDELDPSASIR